MPVRKLIEELQLTRGGAEAMDIEVKVSKDLRAVVTQGGAKFAITPDGNVTVYTNEDVQIRPATADTSIKKEGVSITISKDFNTVAVYGAIVGKTAEGKLAVSTHGIVTMKPAAANDTSVSAETEGFGFEAKVGKDLSAIILDGTKLEISPEGNVAVFTNEGVQRKRASTDIFTKEEGTSINIGEDFKTFSMCGATVEAATGGKLAVSTNGIFTIAPILSAVKPAVTNYTAIAAAKAALEIGYKDKDGWIYAGVSPDTGKSIFVAPADAGRMSRREAMKAAAALQKQGKTDTRLPSEGELKQIFNNKAKIGGFNETGSMPAAWYWLSSTRKYYDAYARDFRDTEGYHFKSHMRSGLSVRFVRSGII